METIPDNYDFFRMHEDEQDEWLEQRPVCVCCGDHIQDDYCYDVGGEIYCEDCMVSLVLCQDLVQVKMRNFFPF